MNYLDLIRFCVIFTIIGLLHYLIKTHNLYRMHSRLDIEHIIMICQCLNIVIIIALIRKLFYLY